MVYSGGAWAAAAAAIIAGQIAAGQAEQIPILDPVLTDFLNQTGLTFTAFAEALDAIGIDLEALMAAGSLTRKDLDDLFRDLLESKVAWLQSDAMINTIALAVEDNTAHMEATWGAVEIQWHDWAMDEIERRIERSKAELEQDRSFWGRVWGIVSDPLEGVADYWKDITLGAGQWASGNMLSWLESMADDVIGLAGRILDKVW